MYCLGKCFLKKGGFSLFSINLYIVMVDFEIILAFFLQKCAKLWVHLKPYMTYYTLNLKPIDSSELQHKTSPFQPNNILSRYVGL